MSFSIHTPLRAPGALPREAPALFFRSLRLTECLGVDSFAAERSKEPDLSMLQTKPEGQRELRSEGERRYTSLAGSGRAQYTQYT